MTVREPNLAMISISDGEQELSSLHSNFANSAAIHNDSTSLNGRCSSSGSTQSGGDSDRLSCYAKSPCSILKPSLNSKSTLQVSTDMLPRSRRSLDASSLHSHSTSSKTSTQEEEEARTSSTRSSAASSRDDTNKIEKSIKKEMTSKTSTPARPPAKKTEKKHSSTARWLFSKMLPATSPSSAEEESGFSSLNSFHEVGLPHPFSTPLSPIKGCHTEIGLPQIPHDSIPHRRWSSTPAEMKSMFQRHNNHYNQIGKANPESLSVWV